MKYLLFFLLLIPTFSSCETYSEFSEPLLTGGAWIFTDYQIVVINSISPVTVIQNDTVCINAFGEQSFVNGGILMKQNYLSTSIDRRFIRGLTMWEFDDNSYSLYIDHGTDRYYVNFPSYLMKEYDKIQIDNPYNGVSTTYSFLTNAVAANYATKLTLTSPAVVSDLLLSNGMREKAVTVKIILIFTR